MYGIPWSSFRRKDKDEKVTANDEDEDINALLNAESLKTRNQRRVFRNQRLDEEASMLFQTWSFKHVDIRREKTSSSSVTQQQQKSVNPCTFTHRNAPMSSPHRHAKISPSWRGAPLACCSINATTTSRYCSDEVFSYTQARQALKDGARMLQSGNDL